jgi:hypothetical protein
MKNYCLTILLSLVLSNVYSQNTNCDCPVDDDFGKQLLSGLIGTEYHNPVAGYDGTQYFNYWTQGEVILNNGDVIRNIYIRYDKFYDELLWIRNTDFKTGILKKGAIAGFRLYDDKHKQTAMFTKIRIDLPYLDTTETFLQVLVAGDLTLYAYRNTSAVWRENKLLDNTKYMIMDSGKFFWIDLKRKSLLDLPVIQRTKMKGILRSNRIMVRNDESETARAVELYNSSP